LFSAARAAGLGDLESRKTIASGLNDGILKPREIPARAEDAPPISAPTSTPAPWGAPIPFAHHDLPPFPTYTLPARLARFVVDLATATQTPPDLAGVLSLAALATACARRFVVSPSPGYSEPVNLFVVVALDPGNRKSAVFGKVAAPIEEWEKQETERLRLEVAGKQAAWRILKASVERAESAASKAKDDMERLELTDQAKHLAQDLAASPEPVLPRLLAGDSTPEELEKLIAAHNGRMAILSSEGGIFDSFAGRYTSGPANIIVYLCGHAGDTLRVDRVNRPSVFIPSPALTVGIAVQPEVLRGLLDKPQLRGRGLLGRFLYSVPRSLLGRRDLEAQPMSTQSTAGYAELVQALLTMPARADGTPETVLFSPAARRVLKAWEREIEPTLGEDGALSSITDWAGKLVGATVRLAGLLHAAGLVGKAQPWEVEIEEETAVHAVALGKYFRAHAETAYAVMATDPRVESARRVMRWCVAQRKGELAKREIYRGLRGRFPTVADLDPILALLEQHEILRPTAPTRAEERGRGRKPSTVYELNPNLAGPGKTWTQLPEFESGREPGEEG
jgi:hypothetical protein